MSEIFFHDTHLHLDLFKDIESIIKYIEKNKSYTIAMTNLPDLYIKYIKKYKDLKYIRFALGFHPELINEYSNQMKTFEKEIENARYVGEIGLNKTKDKKDYEKQKELFKYIMSECEKYKDKIISIHSRNSVPDILNCIEEKSNCKIIMHWFSGSINELDECIKRGFYFSINIKMINGSKGRQIVNRIPLNKILIESDEPLASGKQNYNLYFVKEIIESIANSRKKSFKETNNIIKENFKRLLQ